MHSRQRLSADLRSLGIASGDVVMAHASVRAVGEVAGGPDEIHLAIKDALTAEGTLLMYAGCPRYVDEVGRGNLSHAEEGEILEKLPPFDPDTARSARDHGILVEFLRSDAWCHLLPIRGLLQFARPIMERVAVDPRAADSLPKFPR